MDGTAPSVRVALVTGGYKRLGLHLSRALGLAGFQVVATYRSDPELARAASVELGIPLLKADMSQEDEVNRVFDTVEHQHGTIGVLVNNVSSFPIGPLMDLDPSSFREAFESCVYSSFYSIKRAVPGMKGARYGRIINIGLAGADKVKGYTEIAAHGAAKTALAVLTRSLAPELAPFGITVNMVNPGRLDLSKGPGKNTVMALSEARGRRMVSPEAVVSAVMSLVNDGSRNGELLDVE